MSATKPEIWLVRHAETAWSKSGQHTGRTDLELLPEGREKTKRLTKLLAGEHFALVLTSPLKRAAETASILGFGGAERNEDLREWDYGAFEGRTTAQIREGQPGWSVWSSPIAGGESAEQVGERALRVLARAEQVPANVLLFAHGHLLRILAACWLGLSPREGRLLALSTGSLSVLGYEHENHVLKRWNSVPLDD